MLLIDAYLNLIELCLASCDEGSYFSARHLTPNDFSVVPIVNLDYRKGGATPGKRGYVLA